MRYLLHGGKTTLHKVKCGETKTVCGLKVKASDLIYIDRKPTFKITLNCPGCFTKTDFEKYSKAQIQAYYNQGAYWGYNRGPKIKSTVAPLIEKPDGIVPEPVTGMLIPVVALLDEEEFEEPVTRLLARTEEEKVLETVEVRINNEHN